VLQAALFVALHVLGLALCLAFGPYRRPWLCAALGFIVGLAVYVLVALALLGLGIPYRLSSIAPVGAVLLVAATVVIVRRGLDPRTGRVAAGWTAAFALASVALAVVDVSLLSYDSHVLVMLGGVLGTDGGLAPGTLQELNAWGVFHPIAQSAATLLGLDYLPALQPHLSLSLIAIFAIALADGARAAWGVRPEPRRVALVTAAVATIFHLTFHFVYIHNNLGTAVYLFGYVALFWLAEVDRDPSLLPVAFLCLIAAAIHRVEMPLFALMFAVLTTFPTRLPARAVGAGLVAFAVVVGGWYALLARHVPASGYFLTASRCWLVVAVLVAVVVAWFASRRGPLSRLTPWTGAIVLGGCALALAATFALAPAHMGISVRNWALNLFVSEYWGLAWPVLIVAIALASRLAQPPDARIFVVGLPAAVGLILLMAYGRTPYRAIHVGDSANRMMLHLVPTLFYYLGLVYIGSGRTIRPSEASATT